MIAPALGGLGFLIYECVIHPLGMLICLRKGDAYIERQRARIEVAEKRLKLRQAKTWTGKARRLLGNLAALLSYGALNEGFYQFTYQRDGGRASGG